MIKEKTIKAANVYMYVAARYKPEFLHELASLPFSFFLFNEFISSCYTYIVSNFFDATLGFTFHYGGNFRRCLQHCALLPVSVNACVG
jgi:hypothetical protein